jgi:hypothetical protein
MKNELYYIVLIVTSLISCGGEKTKSSDNLDSIKYATQKMYEDSIKRVEELKVEAECNR